MPTSIREKDIFKVTFYEKGTILRRHEDIHYIFMSLHFLNIFLISNY